MKKIILRLLTLVMALSMAAGAGAQQLAFPGAEGFGRFATGGRGGTIYHVTNLNDSGAGSFRDAVSGTGRIIVFDVSGVIHLKSALVVKGNNTILGQTAPGEGVQIYGDRISFSGANNLIVRYMRFRMGASGTSGADACGIANGENMIFDHLSVLWGRDENFSVNWDNKGVKPANITIQNSIIGQGLQSHSCGGLIQSDGGVTIYRNLYIENKTRNVKAKGLNQYVNNVIYNWGDGGAYIMGDSEGDSWAEIRGNYFMNGPWNGATRPFTRGTPTFRFYGFNNIHDSNKDGVANGVELTVDEMSGMQSDGRYSTYIESIDALNANITAYNEANGAAIQTFAPISDVLSADEALSWVILNVGPVLPVRDEVDQYIIDELCSYGTFGTKNGISSELQLPHKGTGTLSGGVKPADSDNDGIPDEWELANGLDPNDPSDAVAIADNGYANIEIYANSIVSAYPYIKKPVKLTLTRQAKESLSIAWDVNKNTEHGFVIEISTDGVNFAEHATTAANVSAYEITGLTADTSYWIRLRATDSNGLYSDYTDVLATETINDPSAPKLSVNPSPANGEKVGVASGLDLTWENATKDYDGTVLYTVYIGESATGMTAVATDIKVKTWHTDDLQPNKTYYWRVDARNDLGTTEGTVWTFTTTSGGVLFYSDFHTCPQGWADAYGDITSNTNIINAANTSKTIGGMTIGSGDNAIRVVAMNGANRSDDLNADYGPATDDDRGATDRCIQFVTTAAGGYITLPEVQGPCVLTLYLGNPDKSSKTVKLNIITPTETIVQDLVLGASKRIYKHVITYTNAGPVTFKIDANAKKFNINDIIIERWVPSQGDESLELTSGALVNDITYADGSLSLTFNQEVKYNGGAVVSGCKQYENIAVGASGTRLNISYEALDVLSTYEITFPAGALTDVTGDKSFVGVIKLNTCDFPQLKEQGDTHYGKAATTLPLNFAPFTAVAPFETEGGLVQSAQNDYPHWVQVSGGDNPGEIADDYVVMTTKNDKVMSYFGPSSQALYLQLTHEGTGDIVLKVQESRNCDITPGWRTVRVFHASDLPFDGTLALNPESHFIKISVPTITGKVKLGALRISDAAGNFGDDFGGVGAVTVGAARVSVSDGNVTVTGLRRSSAVSVYDMSGRLLKASSAGSDGSVTVALPHGLYMIVTDGVVTKIAM